MYKCPVCNRTHSIPYHFYSPETGGFSDLCKGCFMKIWHKNMPYEFFTGKMIAVR